MHRLRVRRALRSPDSAAISSFWPLPDTPAMPTISPARTARLMFASGVPNGSSAGSDRSCTTSASAPALPSRCCGCGRSPPIIMRASDDDDSWRGSQVPVTLPPRSTVALWHSARISSSLWLMYRMLQPSAASRRSVSNSFSTACGVSTDVGSSMISRRGSCSRQRTISTRCRSPTDIVCTCRSGSSGRPYFADTSRIRAGRSLPARSPSSASAMLSATVSVSNSEKCWNTMPMPRRRARAGLAMVTAIAFPRDDAGVRLHHAVDDLHQRGLAGAVLAEHRVDLAGQHRQVDVLVGDDRRVDLGDAGQLEAWRHEVRRDAAWPCEGAEPGASAAARTAPRARSRSASNSAATATAMAPGSLLRIPTVDVPIGHVMRASYAGVDPACRRRFSNWLRFDCEPIRPR